MALTESPFPGDPFKSEHEPFTPEWAGQRNLWAASENEAAAKREADAVKADPARRQKANAENDPNKAV